MKKVFTNITILLLLLFGALSQLGFSHQVIKKEKEIKLRKRDISSTNLYSSEAAHTWMKRYSGGDATSRFNSFAMTDDGHLIISGTTKVSPLQEISGFILKLSPNGNIAEQIALDTGVWTPRLVTEKVSNGFVSFATLYLSWGIAPMLIKLSPELDLEWNQMYEPIHSGSSHSVIQNTQGNIVTSGLSGETDRIHKDIWILEIDPLSGTVIQGLTIGGLGYESDWLWGRRASSIIQTIDSGYVLAADTESFGSGERDVWVIKFSPTWEVEFQKTYGAEKNDYFYDKECIKETPDGGFLVVSYTESFGNYKDIWLLKLTPDGDIEWDKVLQLGNHSEARAIELTEDSGFVVVGKIWPLDTNDEEEDFFGMKLSPDGKILWSKSYGRKNVGEGAVAVKEEKGPNNNFLLIGGNGLNQFTDVMEIIVMKVSETGELGPNSETLVRDIKFNVISNTGIIATDTYQNPVYGIIGNAQNKVVQRIEIEMEESQMYDSQNMLQPPVNVLAELVENRSMYYTETLGRLTWSANPINQEEEIEVVKYNIYRMKNKKFPQLIASVPSDTFEYLDIFEGKGVPKPIHANEYTYFIRSADKNDVESPSSEPALLH